MPGRSSDREFDASLNVKAELDLLPAVVEFARLFFQAKLPARPTGLQLYHLQVCVSEAFTNIVRHGYGEGEDGMIRVEFLVRGATVTIRLVDEGRPFDPAQAPAPDLDNPQGHGLGVFFLRELTERLEYRRAGGHNILTLTLRA